MSNNAAKSLRNKLGEWRTWNMTRKKTVLSVRKAAGYFCGGSVPKFKTDSWFPLRGIAAKTAMAAREKRATATENITTPRGIHLRLCRSIQAEGAFALLKNDFGFRRFLTTGKANVRTEMFFLALAFNLKKLWMKREHGRLQTRVSEKMTA